MVSALINDTSLYCLIARFTQEEEGEKEEFEGGRGGELEEEEEKVNVSVWFESYKDCQSQWMWKQYHYIWLFTFILKANEQSQTLEY